MNVIIIYNTFNQADSNILLLLNTASIPHAATFTRGSASLSNRGEHS